MFVSSCESLINTNKNSELDIASSFNYETTKNVEVVVNTLDDNSNPVAKVKFKVAVDGQTVSTGITNSSGCFTTVITVPSSISAIEIMTDNIFYDSSIELDVVSDNVEYTYDGFYSDEESSEVLSKNSKANDAEYTYFDGGYDSDGVPNYLESPGDAISNSLLSFVNTNLDGSNIAATNPDIITGESDIILKDDADVWVTFVYEDAGYQNSLGFFTYNNNNPPESIEEINEHKIIFPNTSRSGSGGNLTAGSKVHLGTFTAGTAIGWFLVSDGWNGTEVGDGNYVLYSRANFNDSGEKQNVLLNYTDESKIILGFEDIRRDYSGCDQDFNDVLFMISSNPIDAIDTDNIYNPTGGADDDGDGVANADDDFPSDPEKSFSNIMTGNLAFEDLWPNKGDYDFNDLVLKYEFNRITKYVEDATSYPVTYLEAKFIILAAGATFNNGFGLELSRLDYSDIESVTGTLPDGTTVSLESGQTHPVVILSDNINDDFFNGATKINTIQDYALINPTVDTVKVLFKMSNYSYKLRTLGTPPYNPFLIVNGNSDNRKEIHLSGLTPTDKNNESLLGTGDDISDPSSDIYYKDINGMPWALNFPIDFAYPIEDADIRNVYGDFSSWAGSLGQNNTNWYYSPTTEDSVYSR